MIRKLMTATVMSITLSLGVMQLFGWPIVRPGCQQLCGNAYSICLSNGNPASFCLEAYNSCMDGCYF